MSNDNHQQLVDVDELVMNTLRKTGLPVAFIVYKGEEIPYIVYQRLLEHGQSFADDDNTALAYHYRASLFSKQNYRHILTTVKAELKRAGFYDITINGDMYENDTALFHCSFDFSFIQGVEDTDDTESEVQ